MKKKIITTNSLNSRQYLFIRWNIIYLIVKSRFINLFDGFTELNLFDELNEKLTEFNEFDEMGFIWQLVFLVLIHLLNLIKTFNILNAIKTFDILDEYGTVQLHSFIQFYIFIE